MINLVPKMACCCLGYFPPGILWKGLDQRGERVRVKGQECIIFYFICLDFFPFARGKGWELFMKINHSLASSN